MVGTLLPFNALVSTKYPNNKLAAARLFIDWLAATDQKVWQMLPVSPHYSPSPYLTAGIGVAREIGTVADLAALSDYAARKSVELWGDLPFYLDKNSPLVKKYQACFLIDKNGSLPYVSGSLKDTHFSARQVWGLPLYDYSSAEKIALALDLWKTRIKFLASFFTKVRLDAAIRFFLYEKLSSAGSRYDTLAAGPGASFFTEIINYARSCGLELIAEDISGLDMTLLYQACRKLKVPTMSVFTMVLAPAATKIRRQDFDLTFPRDQIYYTSTHDSKPIVAYLESLTPAQRALIAGLFKIDLGDSRLGALALRRVFCHKAPNLIVPIQDWLLTKDRINVPGSKSHKNWHYRMTTPIEELPLDLLD